LEAVFLEFFPQLIEHVNQHGLEVTNKENIAKLNF
jgi:hypothetical protein